MGGKDRTAQSVEAVNEAAGLLVRRMSRLSRQLHTHCEEDTEGIEESLEIISEYLEERLPRIIRKSREKTERSIPSGELTEDQIEE